MSTLMVMVKRLLPASVLPTSAELLERMHAEQHRLQNFGIRHLSDLLGDALAEIVVLRERLDRYRQGE